MRWMIHARYVLWAIGKLDEFVQGDWERFHASEGVQIQVYFLLQTIGEATTRLPDGFKSAHPEVPWVELKELRNTLAHHYIGIDNHRVEATVRSELPVLEAAVNLLVQGKDAPSGPTSTG